MNLNDFHYDLPPELIARYPLQERSASRLLCLHSEEKSITHQYFTDLLTLLHPGDLLVFNNTKVIPARLIGRKITGGQVEILVERILDDQHVLAQMRVSKPPKVGDVLLFDQDYHFRVIEKKAAFYQLKLESSTQSVLTVIEAIGQIPLPPYMHRAPDQQDIERYQTIYAEEKGSVAAPTAGLHFDQTMLKKLQQKGIEMGYLTLHIGAGTFSPVRTQNIADHQMHAEYAVVSDQLCAQIARAKTHHHRVIAVGTTSVRALETASQSGITQPYQGDTAIFMTPGYTFQCVDALITNLHLPCSTLLMLVSAFGGHEQVMQAYQAAVANQYRFYSYGDAMFVTKSHFD